MKQIIDAYYSFMNIPYYYVECREQKELIEIDGNHIYVSGKDSILQTTYKTIHAFYYLFKHHIFDFYIRSNISTVIDIIKLQYFLNSIPSKNIYCGGYVWNLQWIEKGSGEYDESLFGLNFVEGTSIILSNDLIQHMCFNKSNVSYELVDDLAIAKYVHRYFPHIDCKKYTALCERVNKKNIDENLTKNVIFYRNHTDDREEDCEMMDYITSKLRNNTFS